MAAGEGQAEQLIRVVRVIAAGPPWRLPRAAARFWRVGDRKQRQLRLAGPVAAEPVNCLSPGGGGQPAAGVRREALAGPVLECLDERVLHQFFGQADIAEPGCQHGPDPDSLLPVNLLKFGGIVHTPLLCGLWLEICPGCETTGSEKQADQRDPARVPRCGDGRDSRQVEGPETSGVRAGRS